MADSSNTLSFPNLQYKLLQWGDYSLTLGQLLSAVVVLLVTIYVSKLIRHSITRLATIGSKTPSAQIYTINRVVHYLLLAVGFFIALSMVGIDVSKLALLAGALGIGVGLGLQNIVNNFVSGVTLLLEKSIRVGDFIEFSDGIVGEVLEINIRATLVRTNDNVDILVPNSELFATRVINWTLDEAIRRFRIPFGVAYGSDKERVREAALEAAHNVGYTLGDDKYKPLVLMTGFGDSSLDFELAVWVRADMVKRPAIIQSAYLWEIDSALRRHGIEIPFPQRDLHLRSTAVSLGGRQDSED